MRLRGMSAMLARINGTCARLSLDPAMNQESAFELPWRNTPSGRTRRTLCTSIGHSLLGAHRLAHSDRNRSHDSKISPAPPRPTNLLYGTGIWEGE